MSLQPSRLSIEVRDERSIVLSGVIDAHTSTLVDQEAIALGSSGNIDVDLAEVDFVDSSGLRALVAWHEELAGAGHRLTICSPTPPVVRLFEISGLLEHLNFR